jgi:SAM-dependent methyltransferase
MTPGVLDVPGRARRVRFSIESLGWRRALTELVTARRPYDPAQDRSFDSRHGTDTAGSVEPDQLGITHDRRREQAILYLPSPPRVTNWMLDHVVVDLANCAFVDLGSGKGRVLLIAAQRSFRRVIGIEISPSLAAIARRNITDYRPPPPHQAPIEIVEADVTTVDLPTCDLLIHLYHPFDPAVTAAVLRRLEQSLVESPRRVTVAYLAYTAAVAPVTEMLSSFGWLTLSRYEQSLRGHYNWLIYSN